jgi:hypothetical protein
MLKCHACRGMLEGFADVAVPERDPCRGRQRPGGDRSAGALPKEERWSDSWRCVSYQLLAWSSRCRTRLARRSRTSPLISIRSSLTASSRATTMGGQADGQLRFWPFRWSRRRVRSHRADNAITPAGPTAATTAWTTSPSTSSPPPRQGRGRLWSKPRRRPPARS